MVTEAQQRLAHFIAKAGIWKYSATIELLEKRSTAVEDMKIAAREVVEDPANVADTSGPDWHVNRAYIFARTVDEEGIAKFGTAYLAYLRRDKSLYKEKIERFKNALLGRGKWYASREDKEAIMPTWLAMMAEKDEYLQKRAALCMEGDPLNEEASK